VLHLSFIDVAAGARNLEPAEVADGGIGAAHRAADGSFDALLRRAHHFDDAVNMIVHGDLQEFLTSIKY
jgi:hypothetical protein